MKKVTGSKVVRSLVAAALLALPLQAVAAPSNVVIVALTGGDYSNPNSAITSISGASATNRYLVKIMPGEYDLGSGSLQMYPYIDVEGSGAENTVIKSANVNADSGTCANATVLMANNSAIRNLRIVNNTVADSGDNTVGLAFNDVSAKAEGVGINVGSDNVYSGYRTTGVCVTGTAGNANLNNIYVETHSASGQSNSLFVDAGNITLTNSKLVAFNPGSETNNLNSNNGSETTTSTITVRNSTFDGTAPFIHSFQVYGNTKVLIKDTVMNASAGANGEVMAFRNEANVTISGSKFISDIPVTYMNSGTVKADTTLLPSDYSSLQNDANVTLTYCYNETGAPI